MDLRHPSGGSRELARLIDGYGEYLIPDLKHYHGIDLRDLFSEVNPITPVWALIHINNLPIGSASKAEMRGGQEFLGWDEDRYMRATQINAMKVYQYLFTLANSDPDGRKPDPPEMYPLPDKTVRQKSADRPGSFAFIAKSRIAAARKKKQEGR